MCQLLQRKAMHAAVQRTGACVGHTGSLISGPGKSLSTTLYHAHKWEISPDARKIQVVLKARSSVNQLHTMR